MNPVDPTPRVIDTEPEPPHYISMSEATYNGRSFYGDGMGCNGHADMRSELTYLRDWQVWALREFKRLRREL